VQKTRKLKKKGKIMKKYGFTLAEVLITLAIIGVVAALTIPTLWDKIGTIVNSNRKEVIEDRLLNGLNQLSTLDDGMNASQYEDTKGFVKALSKYYKMFQICGANDLQNCFPYTTITYTSNDEEATINVTDLTTAENFKLSSDEYLAPAGFISAQGTPFVMLLKKDCIMDTGTAMRSLPTSCIQYMYDRNGSNNPNKLGTDIIHSASIALYSGKAAPDGRLAVPIGSYTTYLILGRQYQGGDGIENGLDTCTDTTWDERGSSNSWCSNNRWAAAKKACSDAGYNLPTPSELGKLNCRLGGRIVYHDCDSGNCTAKVCDTYIKDTSLATAIAGKSSPAGDYWSSLPSGSRDAYYVDFHSLAVKVDYVGDYYSVVCLGN